MKRQGRLWRLIPPWEMPNDPVKAVWWFFHWLLKLVVNFFWLPIVGMMIFQISNNWRFSGPFNGIISGVVTLLVGLVVWAALFGLLTFVNISTGVSQVLSDAAQMRQHLNARNPYAPFIRSNPEPEGPIVEGSITDLDTERRKRRQEQ